MNSQGEELNKIYKAKQKYLEEGSRPFHISSYGDYDEMFQTFFRLQKDSKIEGKNVQKSTQSKIAHNYVLHAFSKVKDTPFIETPASIPLAKGISTPQSNEKQSSSSLMMLNEINKISYDTNYSQDSNTYIFLSSEEYIKIDFFKKINGDLLQRNINKNVCIVLGQSFKNINMFDTAKQKELHMQIVTQSFQIAAFFHSLPYHQQEELLKSLCRILDEYQICIGSSKRGSSPSKTKMMSIPSPIILQNQIKQEKWVKRLKFAIKPLVIDWMFSNIKRVFGSTLKINRDINTVYSRYLLLKQAQINAKEIQANIDKIKSRVIEQICRICDAKFRIEEITAHSNICIEKANQRKEILGLDIKLSKIIDKAIEMRHSNKQNIQIEVQLIITNTTTIYTSSNKRKNIPHEKSQLNIQKYKEKNLFGFIINRRRKNKEALNVIEEESPSQTLVNEQNSSQDDKSRTESLPYIDDESENKIEKIIQHSNNSIPSPVEDIGSQSCSNRRNQGGIGDFSFNTMMKSTPLKNSKLFRQKTFAEETSNNRKQPQQQKTNQLFEEDFESLIKQRNDFFNFIEFEKYRLKFY